MPDEELISPLSHLEIIKEDNKGIIRLSPSARVIVSNEGVIIFDNHQSRVFKIPKNSGSIRFFRSLVKRGMTKEEALKILKPLYKAKAEDLLWELRVAGVIW